jgi:hypothetical protein
MLPLPQGMLMAPMHVSGLHGAEKVISCAEALQG